MCQEKGVGLMLSLSFKDHIDWTDSETMITGDI